MKRDVLVDVYRGIAIVLVLVGHAKFPVSIYNFIFSFHLGLFFIGKGFFIDRESKKYSVIQIIRKNLVTLLLPYILVLILNCFFLLIKDIVKYQTFHPVNLMSHFLSVLLYSNSFFLDKYGYYIYLWFIPIFFITSLVLFLIYKYMKQQLLIVYVLVLLLLIFFYGVFPFHQKTHVPWEIDKLPLTVFLAMTGIFIYRHLDSIKKFSIRIFFLVSPILGTSIFFRFDMREMIFPHILLFILYMILGCLWTLSVSELLFERSNRFIPGLFAVLGKNSLFVYIIHTLIYYNLESMLRFIKNPFFNAVTFDIFAIFLSVLPFLIIFFKKNLRFNIM